MAYWNYELSLESSLWTFLKIDAAGLFLSFVLDYYYYLSHLRNLTSPWENRSLNKSTFDNLHDKYRDYWSIGFSFIFTVNYCCVDSQLNGALPVTVHGAVLALSFR